MSERITARVRGPGLALMLVGALSALGNLASAVFQVASALRSIRALFEYGTLPDWLAFLAGQWGLLFTVAGFFVAFVVVAAGARLQALRSLGLVVAGSVLAMLPCCMGFPCCVLGAPVGIWALVVLQDAEVRGAFT